MLSNASVTVPTRATFGWLANDRRLLGLVGILGLLGTIELLPRLGVVEERYLPSFIHMMEALVQVAQTSEFWLALLATLRGWAIGIAIAMALGLVLGFLIGTIPELRAATNVAIEVLRPIPSVALIPVAILIYGTDMKSTLLIVVYSAFWQILMQSIYALRDVDPVMLETARSYRFGRLSMVRHVLLPSGLPYIITGFRLAAGVALILEITGELLIGSPGLGKLIAVAQSSGAVAPMYGLIIVAGLIGVAVNMGARQVERRVLRWHPSMRREAAQ